MDFRLSADEARFQREVRDWLAANLPSGWGSRMARASIAPVTIAMFVLIHLKGSGG